MKRWQRRMFSESRNERKQAVKLLFLPVSNVLLLFNQEMNNIKIIIEAHRIREKNLTKLCNVEVEDRRRDSQRRWWWRRRQWNMAEEFEQSLGTPNVGVPSRARHPRRASADRRCSPEFLGTPLREAAQLRPPHADSGRPRIPIDGV